MKKALRLLLIVPGRPKKKYIQQAVADYLNRLSHYASVQLIEVKDVADKKGKAVSAIQEEEAGRLIQAVPARALKIALDEHGEQLSSVELANFLEVCMVQNRNSLAFLVGGETGLHPSLLQRVEKRLSLSRMTFPHDLVRVLLLEQLYRAMTILAGQQYHK